MCTWIKRFIYFSGRRHPAELGEPEVKAFLNHLAAEREVAASTQNQALSALLFLYKEVLGRELPWLDGLQRASRPPRLPAVLTRMEVERLLALLQGTKWLIASLLYGSGLRVLECLQLRVKDVDLAYRQILVRDVKGEKDRVTMLPEKLVEPMRSHLERVRMLHARVVLAVHLSVRDALRRPAGQRSAAITSTNRCRSARSRRRCARRGSRSTRAAIYTHALNKGGRGVRSPLDR